MQPMETFPINLSQVEMAQFPVPQLLSKHMENLIRRTLKAALTGMALKMTLLKKIIVHYLVRINKKK